MPQITECRLGNILETDNGYVKVISLTLGGPMVTEPWPHQMEIYDAGATVRPASITKAWLERLGFPKDGSTLMATEGYTTAIERQGDELWFIGENEDDNFFQIRTVHHLQNLYFALTGEELPVKRFTK